MMQILFSLAFGLFTVLWISTAFVFAVPIWRKIWKAFPSKAERNPVEDGYKYPTI